MKVSIRLLLSFSLLAPIFAHSQAIPQGTFQHIIIVVQENRTPDNLFGSAPSVGATCGSPDPFEAGVGTYSGYVSGACAPGKCPNKVFPYVHDFGSILSFIEWNFSAPPNSLPPIAPPYYADVNAPDNVSPNIPLSDFFGLSKPRPFTSITYQYNAQFFENYYYNNPSYTPTGPDGGPDD